MRRTISAVADALLWATALLGIVALGSSAVMLAAGARPVIVQSGSMEPGIRTGAVAVVHRVPVTSVKVGDVLAVHLPSGQRVLHRVVERTDTPAGVAVVTKGDANKTADADPVVLHDAYREVVSIAGVGRVAALLHSPLAGFLAALLLLGPLAVRRRSPAPAPVPEAAPAA
ncbi:MAG TPA: signal peptidase I [Acidimicrobiales bacterium]|nr:signal peptidase I [Acidimicrobiales bacterium]